MTTNATVKNGQLFYWCNLDIEHFDKESTNEMDTTDSIENIVNMHFKHPSIFFQKYH